MDNRVCSTGFDVHGYFVTIPVDDCSNQQSDRLMGLLCTIHGIQIHHMYSRARVYNPKPTIDIIIYNHNLLNIIHCFTQKWDKKRTFPIFRLNSTYRYNYAYYCNLNDSFSTLYLYGKRSRVVDSNNNKQIIFLHIPYI